MAESYRAGGSDLIQPRIFGNHSSEMVYSFARLAVLDDNDRHLAIRRLVRRYLQSALAGADLRSDHDAVGHARAWRFRPIKIGDGQPAWVGLQSICCVQTYPDADWDKGPERAMNPSAHSDPFCPGFRMTSRGSQKREDKADMTNYFHRHTLRSKAPSVNRFCELDVGIQASGHGRAACAAD
jgi:hypothetical protein